MSKFELTNRTSCFVTLNKFCHFSMSPERSDDYLEVTEWGNGEGYDVYISDIKGENSFSLTYGQVIAMKKCIKAIEKSYEKDE